MSLSAGTRLGPYEILAPIGAGGMGEVYRARDPRLGRDVAIKVSAERFSERFEREARAVAALNHANICQIYDVGPNYLVMELVEGLTLAERIKQGAVPFDEALAIARQIGDALEAAHEKGIVHRDLKPANIKIKPDGAVKVLDFGLAKMASAAAGAENPENSPTLTIEATRLGQILGTAAYMAPEQARGKVVGKQADIWAFGVVLYEMLTGRRLFDGETTSDVLAAVLTKEPDWSRAPVRAHRLLQSCMEKDPKRRLRDIGDAWRLLDELPEPQPATRTVLPWLPSGALAVIAGIALFLAWRATRPSDLPLVSLDVDLGADVSLGSFAGPNVIISPDGTRLVYVSHSRLFTRRLDQQQAAELPGTEGGYAPFFSPDGQWVAFFGGGKLRKISVAGGATVTLCEAPIGLGGSWGDDGTLIVNLNQTGGLFRIPANGGVPAPVSEVGSGGGQVTHRWPQILPGGKALLFTAHTQTIGGFDDASIEIMSLADRHQKTVLHGGTYARYLPGGHLIYVNRGTLFAVPFDVGAMEVRGAPTPVLNQVAYSTNTGDAEFETSRTGTLVYERGGSRGGAVTVQFLESDGTTRPIIAKPGDYGRPSISPDGRRLAIEIREGSNQDIWIYELGRDTMTRVTFDGRVNTPIWTPNGRYLVFQGREGISWTRADGAGKPQLLLRTKGIAFPWPLSSDGKRLAYMELGTTTGYDLWTVPLEDDGAGLRAGRPEVFLQTASDERYPTISPDGRWMAYASTESGSFQVYVRAFPDQGGKWQISGTGGAYPMWSPSGRELFFESLDNQIMVAGVSVQGNSFVPDKPRLWSGKALANLVNVSKNLDLAHDGKRIVALMPAPGAEGQSLNHVVFLQNFFSELQRRVAGPAK